MQGKAGIPFSHLGQICHNPVGNSRDLLRSSRDLPGILQKDLDSILNLLGTIARKGRHPIRSSRADLPQSGGKLNVLGFMYQNEKSLP